MSPEMPHDTPDRAYVQELVENETDDLSDFRVWILALRPVPMTDIANRRGSRGDADLGLLASCLNGELNPDPVFPSRVQSKDAADERAVGVRKVDDLVAVSQQDAAASSHLGKTEEVGIVA
jgi:hypothetical protein